MGDSVPSSKFVNDLPIQNSEPYNRYGPYQCSWFAAGCVAKRQALTEAWTELINQSSPETASCEPIPSVSSRFHALYVEVLVEATHLRATTNPSMKHIQTLFYPPIFQHHQLTLDTWYSPALSLVAHLRYHYVGNESLPDNLTKSHSATMSNADDVKAHKLTFPLQPWPGTLIPAPLRRSLLELEAELCAMHERGHAFLAHRNGQAFAVLPLSSTEFLLLDDHFPIARQVAVKEVLAYLQKGPENAYCIYFWSATVRKQLTAENQ